MAYNWAQLGFVEKWRLEAVRGQVVGMYRPENATFFDLRLRPGEGGAGHLPGIVDVHLLDPGDIIREKRVNLLARLPVVVRVVASAAALAGSSSDARPPVQGRGRSRRWLEWGSRASGKLLRLDEDGALLDVGFPVVARLPEDAAAPALQPGSLVEITIAETPKGFIVA